MFWPLNLSHGCWRLSVIHEESARNKCIVSSFVLKNATAEGGPLWSDRCGILFRMFQVNCIARRARMDKEKQIKMRKMERESKRDPRVRHEETEEQPLRTSFSSASRLISSALNIQEGYRAERASLLLHADMPVSWRWATSVTTAASVHLSMQPLQEPCICFSSMYLSKQHRGHPPTLLTTIADTYVRSLKAWIFQHPLILCRENGRL